MRTQHAIRLDPGLAKWLVEYGGNLTEGIRRSAREIQYIRAFSEQNPEVSVSGALLSTERMLASLGVGQKSLFGSKKS